MSIHTRFAFQRKPTYRPDHRPDHPFDDLPDPMTDPMTDPMPNPSPTPGTNMLLDDWLALYEAVKSRLVAAAAAARPGADELQQAAASAAGVLPAALQTELQECVQALDQLQRMLPQANGTDAGVGAGAETGSGTGNTGPNPALWQIQSALARSQQDLAQAHAARLQASHRALHDGLTTLPNRDCFRQRLELELAQPGCAASGLAVLYLDLDGLKLINDGHGHAVGDELLRIVAARLARAVRAQDMVCRLGGDEFACLLGNVFNRDQLSHLACKLFDAVSAPLKIGDLELTVRPSIGIAVCPTDGNNSDALLRHADSAMYRAKRQQLGYAFFDASSDR